MHFAIRDDDVSYFTTPDNLNGVYRSIWDVSPISFAVVPFLHGSVNFIPKRYQKDHKYPVGENKILVKFLKERINEGKASIMLHGYSHRLNPKGHEFDIDGDLFEKVKEGKSYLEEVFDTKVTSFVAPNHSFSKAGMDAVIRNRLNIVGSPNLKHRPFFFRWSHIKNVTKLSLFRLTHPPGIRYPYPLDFGTHSELYCYSLVPQTTMMELAAGIDFVNKNNGVFCVATHSTEINTRMISVLRKLVEESSNIGAEFVTVDSAL